VNEALDILDSLARHGVSIWAEGSRVRFRAAKGGFPAELKERLAANKGEVLAAWREWAAKEVKSEVSTHAQRALWFLYQERPESPAYNVAIPIRIFTPVDVPALERACQALVDRHPSLRTTYAMNDTRLVQRVRGHMPVSFCVHDRAGIDLQKLRKEIIESSHVPFSLESGPLMRVDLFRRADADFVLLIAVHHIAVDGWSGVLLMEDLRLNYIAETNEGAAPPARPENDVPAFARWQQEMLSSEEGQAHERYWSEALAGEIPALDLPTDWARSAPGDVCGASLPVDLGAEQSEAVRALAASAGTTPFVVLLSAYQALLHRYTGGQQTIVGSPTYGRDHVEFANVIGDFINTIPLKADFSADPTFHELLAQMRQRVIAGLEHQDYPFALLVEKLHPARDASRTPIFQTLFILQRHKQVAGLKDIFSQQPGEARIDFGGLAVESFAVPHNEGQFDVALELVDLGGIYRGYLKYNADLFAVPTVTALACHYAGLLRALVASPETRVSEVPLLSPAEQHQILEEWNDTARNYPRNVCLHQLIAAQAERTPNAVALVFEGKRLTYRELDERANQLAHYLQKLGVTAETRVGISLDRSFEMVIGLLGILKAGGAYVPMDPSYSEARLAFMLQDAGARILLAQKHLMPALKATKAEIVCLDADWDKIARESTDQPEPRARAENLAYMIYTSGSTGRPKGAMNEHRAVVNRLLWMQDEFQFGPADVVVQKAPFSFDVSVGEFFAPLIAGARLVVAKPEGHKDPGYLIDLVKREGVTIMHFDPSMLRIFLGAEGVERCASLRAVVCSGEALPPDLVIRFYAHSSATLHNLYGSTETGGEVTRWTCPRHGDLSVVPIGKPVANTQCYILDQHLQPVPVGVAGELHLGGAQVGRGYHNRPELTAEKFIPDPFADPPGRRLYKTGDLCRYLRDGNIEYLGQIEEHEAFFRQMLGDIDEPTAPFGLLDVRGDGSGIEQAHLAVDPDLARRLRARARKLGVSASSLFHLAWARVLAKVSGREDVVFGTVLFEPTQGSEGADRVTGSFINILPIRIRVGEQEVETAVRCTHNLLADLMRHKHAAPALAQRCSAVPAPVPLFSALLNYRDSPDGEQVLSGEALQAREEMTRPPAEERANSPFIVSVNDFAGDFSLDAQTPASVGPLRVCQFMGTALEALAGALENQPSKAVRTLDVLPASERHRVLHEWNDTGAAFPSERCVHQLFEAQVEKTPDAIAIVFEEESLTYAELNCRANQLAHHLCALGVRPDARVAICIERGLEMIVALLAVLKAGGAYVPLDPSYPPERLRFMLDDSTPLALLTQTRLQALFSGLPGTVPVLDLTAANPAWQNLPESTPDPQSIGLTPNHLAYVIYTSGSTGQPKGVLIQHRSLVNLIQWHLNAFVLQREDRCSSMARFGFDAATWEIWPPLCCGAILTFPPSENSNDTEALLSWWRNQELEVSFLPTPIAELAFGQGTTNNSLRFLLIGGDRLRQLPPPWLRHALINNYGPTETTVVATSGPIDGSSVSIGRPIANTRVYILDARGEPAPVGVSGELYIGGVGVARGYLNRPELTAEKFLDDPFVGEPGARMYRTGDLGRWLPDGNIEFVGRNDFQVKIRGFRIELGEIETRLAQHPAVRQAAVIAREDTSGDKRLVAYYTATAGKTETAGQPQEPPLTAEQLRSHLSATLPEYMVPAAYVRLKSFPLTPNGKVDRRALPLPESQPSSPGTGHVRGRNHVERVMCQIWAEVLGVEEVGIFDHFFELGGHSLTATHMVARLKDAFKTDIPLRSVFIAPTIAEMSKHIFFDDLNETYHYFAEVPHQGKRLVPAQPKGSRIPLYLVAGFMDEDDTLRVLSRIFPYLGLEQPVLGFQPRWVDGHSPAYSSVEEVAREFVDELRVHQPEGPYMLGGDCIGGVVALEMAQEILRQGEQVGLLVMFDTQRPTPFRSFLAGTDIAVRRVAHIAGVVRDIVLGKDGSRLESIRALIRRKRGAAQPQTQSEPAPDFLYRARMGYRQMIYRHRAKPYPGRITLMVNEKQAKFDKRLGWGGCALGGLEIHTTVGDHWSRYTVHSKEFAEQLNDCLERAQAEAAFECRRFPNHGRMDEGILGGKAQPALLDADARR
jgi:amino acid adenylation domain-containing protein